MHSHKGSLSIDLMIKTTPMGMYKQIRKLHLKLHLKRLHLKRLHLKYILKVETVTKSF